MERSNYVSGIGGVFFRSKDPVALGKWYEDNFAINSMKSKEVWRQEGGPTIFAPFGTDTSYFGNQEQMFLINFRVNNLESLLDKLKESGVRIDEKRQNDSIGKFAWVFDPEGNKIELWEPSPEDQWSEDCAGSQ